MSFILDALKKSELERQRQAEPGLMDPGMGRQRSRLPLWAVLLGLLLAVNLVVLAVVLIRNHAPPARAVPARNPVAADSVSAAANAAPHFSPLDPAPVYAPEIAVPSADGARPVASAEPANSPAAPLNPPATRAAAPRALHRSDPLLTEQENPPPDNDEVLPSISEVNLTGPEALPDLHLDVHVYATKPADRFVYINMRKYHEGAVLQEGPTLERIRRDGVVLNFHGVRFVLPRQS
jgi:general secretion pathway protein B